MAADGFKTEPRQARECVHRMKRFSLGFYLCAARPFKVLGLMTFGGEELAIEQIHGTDGETLLTAPIPFEFFRAGCTFAEFAAADAQGGLELPPGARHGVVRGLRTLATGDSLQVRIARFKRQRVEPAVVAWGLELVPLPGATAR